MRAVEPQKTSINNRNRKLWMGLTFDCVFFYVFSITKSELQKSGCGCPARATMTLEKGILIKGGGTYLQSGGGGGGGQDILYPAGGSA